jgi:hypothetical protein
MKIVKMIKNFFIELNKVTTYNIANEALSRIKTHREIMENGTPEEKREAWSKRNAECKSRLYAYRSMRV